MYPLVVIKLELFLCIETKILQLEVLQFFGGAVLCRLRRHFPAQVADQARRDVRAQVRREVPEALHARRHAIRRAQPGSSYVRLIDF